MTGVFVLGMHRSGTSAAARLVNLLGIPTCVEEDLLRTTKDNPRGYWESATLTAFNDRILDALGSDWTCPAPFAPGWDDSPALDALRTEAVACFRQIFPTGQWVWKDPRNCVTFAFWARCLEVRPAVVLVHRNPLEVAASLDARDGLGTLQALALWERYLRECLASIHGLPVLATAYDDLIRDPVAWSEYVREFLESAGLATSPIREEDALAFVDADLRHTSFTDDELRTDPRISEPQLELFGALGELLGTHGGLPAVELPAETPSTEALLAERRRGYAERRDLRRQYDELEAYVRELGERYLELEAYARALQTPSGG